MAEMLAEAGANLKKAPSAEPQKEKTIAEILAEAGANLKKAPTVVAEPPKRALTLAE